MGGREKKFYNLLVHLDHSTEMVGEGMQIEIGIKHQKYRFYLTMRRHRGRCGPVVMNRTRAFTLIELLIVVAIIAILAAIAVPNFLEAQTRAKVARVQADMRSMHTAIETYRVDYNKVPIRHDDWESEPSSPEYIPDADTKIYDPSNPDAAVGLKMITTPISYMSSVPIDVFNTPIQSLLDTYPGTSVGLDYWDELQFEYFRKNTAMKDRGKLGFVLLSVGPDKYIGMNRSEAAHKYPTEPTNLRLTMATIYVLLTVPAALETFIVSRQICNKVI